MFLMCRLQAKEKKQKIPSKSTTRFTKVMNLVFVALITVAVVGQIIDMMDN